MYFILCFWENCYGLCQADGVFVTGEQVNQISLWLMIFCIIHIALKKFNRALAGSGVDAIGRIGLWMVLCSLPLFGWSQRLCYTIPKLSGSIQFDGMISEGEWDSIDTLCLASHWPVFSAEPNARTCFRVAYDEKFFYLSALCYDDSSLVQTPTFERDLWGMTLDQVALILDTYNDNENALIFVVTPTGSRVDASVRNDAQGIDPADVSWNSFWEAKSKLHHLGWSTEMRIPFSSLRFQTTGDQVKMGLIACRFIPRRREMDIFPAIPPDWGFWSFTKPSQSCEISFSNIVQSRPWFVSPYILGSAGHHYITRDDPEPAQKVEDNKLNVGLDVQHALTDNLNLDLSFNTDFAQAEADEQVVNLSRFSLFFPEKRRFFLERSSIMDFSFDDNNRLFHSRRIGIRDGSIIPLWGGIRMVGRLHHYDVGLLTMQSQAQDGFPSENYGVYRLRRRISKGNSYIGGILTTRMNGKGETNLAYGLDGIINLFGNDYLKINLAGMYNSLDSVHFSHFLEDRARIYVLWEKRSLVGFNYGLSYSQVDQYFDPGLGFEARKNYKAIRERFSYGWFVKESRSLRFMQFDLNVSGYFKAGSGRIESTILAPAFYMEWKKNSSFRATFTRNEDEVTEPFDLSDDIKIEARNYINTDLTLIFETPTVNFLNARIIGTVGTLYGGNWVAASVSPSYCLSKYFTLSGFYQYNHIGFSDRPDYLSHVGRIKLAASLNVNWSANIFFQYNSLTRVSALNFRLRYNPTDGRDLYVVYNELLNHDANEDPAIPYANQQVFVVKYVHTFLLGR